MTDEELKYTDTDIEYAKETIEEKYKNDLEAKEEELREQLLEKERLEAELEKKNVVIKEKDQNWSNLRKKTEGADTLKTEIDELKETIQKVAQASKQEIIDDYIAENVGTDAEDIKLFTHRFNILKGKATTAKEVKGALEDAKLLFNKDKGHVYNPMNRVIPTGANFSQEKKADISPEIMQNANISEEDVKKYSNFKPIKYN
jgi:hypothetical protein